MRVDETLRQFLLDTQSPFSYTWATKKSKFLSKLGMVAWSMHADLKEHLMSCVKSHEPDQDQDQDNEEHCLQTKCIGG